LLAQEQSLPEPPQVHLKEQLSGSNQRTSNQGELTAEAWALLEQFWQVHSFLGQGQEL
jgi:hypothetical protein